MHLKAPANQYVTLLNFHKLTHPMYRRVIGFSRVLFLNSKLSDKYAYMFNNFIRDAQYALKFGRGRPKGNQLECTQNGEHQTEDAIDIEQQGWRSEDKNIRLISD